MTHFVDGTPLKEVVDDPELLAQILDQDDPEDEED